MKIQTSIRNPDFFVENDSFYLAVDYKEMQLNPANKFQLVSLEKAAERLFMEKYGEKALVMSADVCIDPNGEYVILLTLKTVKSLGGEDEVANLSSKFF